MWWSSKFSVYPHTSHTGCFKPLVINLSLNAELEYLTSFCKIFSKGIKTVFSEDFNPLFHLCPVKYDVSIPNFSRLFFTVS